MKSVFLLLSCANLLAANSWMEDLQEARRIEQSGDAVTAGKIYQEVVDRSKDLSPPQSNALGMELVEQARYHDAEQAYRQSLASWDRLERPALALSRSKTAGNLGRLLSFEGRYPEADPLLEDELRQAEAAGDNMEIGRACGALASLHYGWGRLEKAESFAARAESIWSAQPDSALERIENQRVLASIFLEESRYAEGEALLIHLLPNLPERLQVQAYNDLAMAQLRQHHLTEADRAASQALDLARRTLPQSHRLLAVTLNNLAQIQRFQGRYLEAEKNYREAIEIWKRALGPQHPDLAKGLMNLAAFYHERERDAGAEGLYRQAAEIFRASYGAEDPLTLVARNELSDVLRAERRYAEAEKLSRETLGQLQQSLGMKDPRVLRAQANYSRLTGSPVP